jgi:hypothetical protein
LNFHYYVSDDFSVDGYIKKSDLKSSKKKLKEVVSKYKPSIVCFVGVIAFEHYFKLRRPHSYGMQDKNLTIGTNKIYSPWVFLLPSTMESSTTKLSEITRLGF